jgi:hypothetical protein
VGGRGKCTGALPNPQKFLPLEDVQSALALVFNINISLVLARNGYVMRSTAMLTKMHSPFWFWQ